MPAKLIGAVDIGGTKTLCGIVDETGTIRVKDVFPTVTGENGGAVCAERFIELIGRQTEKIGVNIKALSGIGISCAGPVDYMNGIVKNPYTLPGWDNFAITQYITQKTGLHARIENDVNCALAGEIKVRGLQNYCVLMLMFGTGIGAALCNRGMVYRAGKDYHPEMGHVIVASEGPECYCGRRGCFESLCSGSALNRRAVEAGYSDFDFLLEMRESGDVKAIAVLDNILMNFKNGIWNYMTLFKPDILILGGGIMKKFYKYVFDAVETDLRNSYDFVGGYQIIGSESAAETALIGAAELILNKI
ncbi:MAG: ROK family protein [Oscillospiraceae bacterium]|nr:ROK family protein [Oscillospiraceae bacterium]